MCQKFAETYLISVHDMNIMCSWESLLPNICSYCISLLQNFHACKKRILYGELVVLLVIEIKEVINAWIQVSSQYKKLSGGEFLGFNNAM